MAAAAASDLESKAKEAFVDDDFELAAELYTQAIEAGPATAELYADRAQAHIKLGSYTGACFPPSPLHPPPLRLDSSAYAEPCDDLSRRCGWNREAFRVPYEMFACGFGSR